MEHSDLICKLSHIDANYQTAGEGWWENQGLGLDAEPDWPGDSIMLVSWPQHVINPRLNGDCTITGPYATVEDARDCAGPHGVDVMV